MAATKVFPKIGSSELMQRHPRITIVTSKHAKYNLQIPGLVGGLGWEARFRLLAPSFDSIWMPLFVKALGRKRTFDSSGSFGREARFRLFSPRGILRNPIFDFVYWGKPWAGAAFSTSGLKFRLLLDVFFSGRLGREARFRLFGPLGIYNIKKEDPKSRNLDSWGGRNGLPGKPC